MRGLLDSQFCMAREASKSLRVMVEGEVKGSRNLLQDSRRERQRRGARHLGFIRYCENSFTKKSASSFKHLHQASPSTCEDYNST